MKAGENNSPVLLVDTREQKPLQFSHLPAESATLYTGDYSVKGLEEQLAIELKRLPDIAMCLTRERPRFMREMHRMRGFPFPYLLIIGDDRELSRLIAMGRINLKQIEHSLQAIQTRYRVHVVRCSDESHAARMVETWAFCAWREIMKPAGVHVQFPDWATGILCPRFGCPMTTQKVIEAIEGGKA